MNIQTKKEKQPKQYNCTLDTLVKQRKRWNHAR